MFKIPIMGDQTGSIEALPSYLHRCANHHSVATCKFIDYLLHDTSDRNPRSAGTITNRSLLRACDNTFRIMEAIKYHTGANLIPTTFSLIHQISTDPRREIHHLTRWCPECFQDMICLDQEPYIKLIWYFRDLDFCPIHKSQLLERCPSCSKGQGSIWKSSAINRCHYCDYNLCSRFGWSGSSWAIEGDISYSRQNQGNDLTKFVLDLIHNQRSRSSLFDDFHKGVPIKTIVVSEARHFSEGISNSIKDFSSMFNLPQFINAYEHFWKDRDLRKQIWGDKPISLHTLRLLAYHSGVDIIDVITGNLNTVASTASAHINRGLPNELSIIRKRKKNHHEKNRKAILFLLSSREPISLKEVAKRTGLSLGYIHYQFPTLKQKIVERHASHVAQMNLKKHHLANLAALEYFLSEKFKDKPKSRKQALIFLIQETRITKLYLKPAINAAYNLYLEG